MDDDGYPFHSDALKEDIDAYNKLGVKNVVINSLVVSEDCETLSFKTGHNRMMKFRINHCNHFNSFTFSPICILSFIPLYKKITNSIT